LRYVLRGLLGANWRVRGVDLAYSEAAVCAQSDPAHPETFVEADGELLGTLPARISIVRDAVTILVPQSFR